MLRTLAAILLLVTLPFSNAQPELPDEPEPTEPPKASVSEPAAGLIDPNWVIAPERDEWVETFAPDDETERCFGMRPLSRYAQVYEPTEEDLILAARVAYLEAGGRSEAAYRAVLCVLYNRCVATRFGGGVTDISTEVYRKGQFSVIHHKRFSKIEPPEAIVLAARDIFLYGDLDLPENILFFCAERLGKHFGGHKFYKNIGDNLFFYGKTD